MSISRRTRQRLATVTLIICMIIVTLFIYSYNTYAYNQKSGTITGDYVNVRTGPGTTNSKLTSGGVNVQLNTGDKVTIIGESKASDGALWYKAVFKFKTKDLTGYIHSDYVEVDESIKYQEDKDFEAYLKKQGFPESYKDSLRLLHAKYPKWVFVADQIDYKWSDVLENESESDTFIGRSLIHTSAISSWKSTDPRAYNWSTGKWYGYDGSSWVVASKELVAYYLDPRNFLDEQSIFQFESLAYDESIHNSAGVNAVIDGSFMGGAKVGATLSYTTAIMRAGKYSGVSPYHLAVRIIQEQGYNGIGNSISGTVKGYEGYYNYFNVGAYAAGGNSAVINGLIYAKNSTQTPNYRRAWNTRYKSILGGAEYLGSGYITQRQDTLYYQKFDLVGTPYTHQYQTGIQAPSAEGKRMSGAYTDDMKKSTALVFKIPVYKSMPSKACVCPTGDGSPNNALSSLKVSGYNLTPTFEKFVYEYDLVVKNSVSSVNISATPLDSSAAVSGTGKKRLKVGANTVTVKVTAKNGTVRNYQITIVRQDSSGKVPDESSSETVTNKTTIKQETTTQTPKVSVSSKYTIKGSNISGIQPGTTVKTALKQFTLKNATAKIYDSNNKELSSGARIGTGCRYIVYDVNGKKNKTYSFVIYGDVSGDGQIDIKDLLYVKLHILGKIKLTGAKLEAADASRKNNGVDIQDLLYVKLHILEKLFIVQ